MMFEGNSENDNIEKSKSGKIPNFDFKPRSVMS